MKYSPLIAVLLATTSLAVSCHSEKQAKTSQVSLPTLSLEISNNPGLPQVIDQNKKIVFQSSEKHKVQNLSNYFVAVNIGKSSGYLLNARGQKIHEFTQVKNGRYLISKNFAGFQNGKASIIWNREGREIVYHHNSPDLKLFLKDNFAAFQIAGQDGALFNQSGHQIMSFKHRGPLALVFSEDVAGFVDPSNTASFWNSHGDHLKSVIKKPGLNVALIDKKLHYKTKDEKNYKVIR